jgi:nicotinamidase-related amidase
MSWSSVKDAPPLLLLLEPREPAGEGGADPRPPAWRSAAAGLLDQVRARGGLVAHVFSSPLGETGRWRVIPDLRPDPAEPVFYGGLSDLENRTVAAYVARVGRGTVILAGASVESAALAAALGLVADGRKVTAAEDALHAAPKEWRGLRALAGLPELPSGGALRIQPAAAAAPVRPQLRIIAGGRA